jgi:hypothetical protein
LISSNLFNIFVNLTKHLQRYEIVNAVVEAEGVTDDAAKEEDDKASEGAFLILIRDWRIYFWCGIHCSLMLNYMFMQRKEFLIFGSLQ